MMELIMIEKHGKGGNTRNQDLPCNKILNQMNPLSSVLRMDDLRIGRHWFQPPAQPIIFQRIDGSHSSRWLCGKVASGLERILCGVLVRTPGKHGSIGTLAAAV